MGLTAERCMIVDDHADVRELIRLILEFADPELDVVGEADSGREAVERVDACDPTVVILDEMMPGMTGLEAARRILERRPDQKFVLFSAYLDSGLRLRAAEAGIRVCLPKYDLDLLPEAIRIADG